MFLSCEAPSTGRRWNIFQWISLFILQNWQIIYIFRYGTISNSKVVVKFVIDHRPLFPQLPIFKPIIRWLSYSGVGFLVGLLSHYLPADGWSHSLEDESTCWNASLDYRHHFMGHSMMLSLGRPKCWEDSLTFSLPVSRRAVEWLSLLLNLTNKKNLVRVKEWSWFNWDGGNIKGV